MSLFYNSYAHENIFSIYPLVATTKKYYFLWELIYTVHHTIHRACFRKISGINVVAFFVMACETPLQFYMGSNKRTFLSRFFFRCYCYADLRQFPPKSAFSKDLYENLEFSNRNKSVLVCKDRTSVSEINLRTNSVQSN